MTIDEYADLASQRDEEIHAAVERALVEKFPETHFMTTIADGTKVYRIAGRLVGVTIVPLPSENGEENL